LSESDFKELEKLPFTGENHEKQVAKMRLVLFEILPGAAK
jgi:hypothetical protein